MFQSPCCVPGLCSASSDFICYQQSFQTILTLKKGESNLESIEEAIDFVSNRLSVDDLALPTARLTAADTSNATPVSQNHFSACASNPSTANHVVGPKSNGPSDKNEVEVPSELIAHCVATLLMIQVKGALFHSLSHLDY